MFRIRLDHPLDDEIRRSACDQLDKALDELEPGVLPLDEAVHQVRKRAKKVRSVLRLARPVCEDTYRAEDTTLRDAARLLAPMREADAVIDTWDDLVQAFDDRIDDECVRGVQAALQQRRRQIVDETDVSDVTTRVRSAFRSVRRRVVDWPLRDIALADMLDGAKKTYKRGRRALASAYDDPSAERFYQWRERVKYGRDQARLLRDLWEDELQLRRKAMQELSDLLGEEHDLARLESIVRAELSGCFDSPTKDLLYGLAARRRTELRARAARLGLRLYAEPPAKFRLRLFELTAALDVDDGPLDAGVATPHASLPA